ncbi:MAG: YitT family protein, partial [Christensenellales bacterium]
KGLITDAAAIVVGSGLTALGIASFTMPNNIAPGGVSGLATAIAHVIPVPVGIMSLLINVPIFLLGLRTLGWKPLVKTGISTVLLSVLIDLFTLLPIQYTSNILLAAVMGGALMGIGIGILFTRNISTGGGDLLSLILKRKRPHLSLGSLMMVLDGTVVAIAVLVFGEVEVALYSIVTIFCCSKLIDAIIQGVDYAKVVYIITENGEDIVRRLTLDMGKGVTQVFARGGYTGRDKMMIMTVSRRTELAEVQKIMRECDPAAFVIYLDATEVHGEGFKQLMDG